MGENKNATLQTLLLTEGAERPGPPPSRGGLTALERRALKQLLAALGDPPLRIRCWDGETVGPAAAAARHTVEIRSRGALWRLLVNADRYFGEDYAAGTIEVDGPLEDMLETVMRHRPMTAPRRPLPYRRRARRNTLRGSRRNIHHHYDIGNDFYALWLDEEMVYTCAYFPRPEADLEAAQRAKMELICRKLRLRPGETVVEAGCGWGALARYMARHYGVKVRAYNVSTEQVRYAREQARAQGLADRVEYIEDDYRNIRDRCDAFVSVGMLEHVGRDNYGELGRVIHRSLSPQGRGLLHSIGQNTGEPMNPWIERHIFPGAYPPTLDEMLQVLRPFDFSVLDVENLRPHYALTLEHWLRRFEAAGEQVEARFDARFRRAWRFYLAGSIASFRSGRLQLFQVLFSRRTWPDQPFNRAGLYEGL